MPPRSYQNLDVVFTRGIVAGTYEARIISSPAGEAGPVAVELGISDDRLALLLMQMAPLTIRSRRVAAPETAATEALGSALFGAVFHDALAEALHESVARAPHGLRVRLRLSQAPELARLPWELLHDRGRLKFLALSERTPVVRYLDLAQPGSPPVVTGALQILAVIASPIGLPALDVEAEWTAICEELRPHVDSGLVGIDRLPQPTMAELRRWLRSHDVHALHFIGHGEFDVARDDGVLYFADDAGNPRAVDPSALGPHLSDHDPLRLVVLNACQTGRSADSDPFGGMAQGLVERGVPAVVAMQFPITDDAAVCFAGDFYAAVACGQPVDQALSGSRRALMDSHGSEWATPVLFLRSDSGDLFNVVPSQAIPRLEREEVPRGPESTGAGPTGNGVRPKSMVGRTPVWAAAAVALLVVGVAAWLAATLAWPDTVAAERSPTTVAASSLVGAGTVASDSATSRSTSEAPVNAEVPTEPTQVPHVYNNWETDGLKELASAGFSVVSSIATCSGSVAEGKVRRVVVDDASLMEVDGPTGASTSVLPLSTGLRVEVSDGHPCVSAAPDSRSTSVGDVLTITGRASVSAIDCSVQLWEWGPQDVDWRQSVQIPDVHVEGDRGFTLSAQPKDPGLIRYEVRIPPCNGAEDAVSKEFSVLASR